MSATLIVALALLGAVIAVWRRDHANALETERAAHERERREWHRERSELLNRIKPETAQYIPPEDPTPADPLPFDDDDAYWADRETREELAERLMAEEMANGRNG